MDREKTQQSFIAERKVTWEELERILDRLDILGYRELNRIEINLLGRLYLNTVSDLAKARMLFGEDALSLSLNNLVARAYGKLYLQKRPRFIEFVKFLLSGFPALVYKHVGLVFVSTAIFASSTLLGFLCLP
ncbi:hypothetical protein HYY75_04860, partial [bacterium]|nr:hypothetical protein [bacterium]